MKRLFLTALFVLLILVAGYLYLRAVASLSDRASRHSDREIQVTLYPAGKENTWSLIGETEHFRYYAWEGDAVPRWAMELHETECISLCQVLNTEVPGKINYHKHPSQHSLREETGSRSTGVVRRTAAGQEIHTVHRYDHHEVSHAVSHHLGEPPAFFDEGLATTYGWEWDTSQTDVHTRALGLLRQGRLPPIGTILTNWDFRRYKSYPAYAAAGSFTGYLLNRYGPDGLRSLFTLDKFSQKSEIEAAFERAYGQSIYEVESEWRAALEMGTLISSRPRQVGRFQFTATGAIVFVSVLLAGALLILAGEKVYDVAVSCGRRLVRTIRERRSQLPDE